MNMPKETEVGTFRRRHLLALLSSSFVPLSQAQSVPSGKTYKIIVVFPAGSAVDVAARIWAEQFSKIVGSPAVVENKPGAATIVGTQALLASPADGYTLLFTVATTTAVNPYLYKKLPYKADDLAPISHVASVPIALVVRAESPFKTVSDLIAAAKKEPGKLNFPSYGTGTVAHIAMERFMQMADINMKHVPYNNGGLTDVISGVLDVSFDTITVTLGHIKAGKVRALGVASAQELSLLPGVPPVADTVPGFEGGSSCGLFAPKNTPADVIDRLNAISVRIVSNPEFRDRLAGNGLVASAGSIQSYKTFLDKEAVVWSKVLKTANISID